MPPKRRFQDSDPVKVHDKMHAATENSGDRHQPGVSEEAKNKGGRPPFNPSGEQRSVVKALAMVGLSREYIAQTIGIDADTLRKHLQIEIRDAKAHLLAKAGMTIFNGMNAAKEETRIATAQYILDRQAKEYGWTTKMDLAWRREMFQGLDLGQLAASLPTLIISVLLRSEACLRKSVTNSSCRSAVYTMAICIEAHRSRTGGQSKISIHCPFHQSFGLSIMATSGRTDRQRGNRLIWACGQFDRHKDWLYRLACLLSEKCNP